MSLLPNVANWQRQLASPPPPSRQIDWTDFSKGMDYTSPDGQVGEGVLRLIKGALLTRAGEIIYPGGIATSGIETGSTEVYDFVRYRHDADANVATGFDAWVYVRNNGGTKQFTKTSTGGSVQVLGTVQASTPQDITVLQMGDRAITTSLDNLPLVWYGVGTTATTLGHAAPNPADPAITIGNSGFGHLGTDGFAPYQHTFAFEDKWGNLTNPNDTLSTPLVLATTFTWTITVKIPTASLPSTLAIADVARIHVYRIGGTSSELRESLVFVPSTPSGGYFTDASTATFPVDYAIDAALPDIFPVFSNLPPPLGLLTLKLHVGRLFGAGQVSASSVAAGNSLGSSSRLWFSRFNLPESWGNDDNGVDDDGGYLDIDDDPSDPILCLESTGSVLVIARRQSIYTMFGNGFTTFRFDKRAPYGVPSRRSICRFGNRVILFCSDGRVYQLGDREMELLSLPVDDFVATSLTDFTKAVLFVHDKRLHVCLPKLSGAGSFTAVLEEKTGAWSVLENRFDVNAAKSVNQPGAFVPSCMVAPRVLSGTGIIQEYYFYPDNASIPTHGDDATLPPSATIELTTDRIRMFDRGQVGRITELYIDAKYTGTITVELTCEGTTKSYTYAYPLTTGTRYGVPPASLVTPIHLQGLPADLEGRWFEIRLTGSVTQLHVRSMQVRVQMVRGSR